MNDFCSFDGKTDVVHVVLPMVTSTRTEPKPRLRLGA